MPRAQNYSVYVRNIPDEYKSNSELEDYFRSCFSDKAVLEARVRIKAPSLQSAVSKRDKLVSQLEHAINYEQLKGQAPQHRSNLVAGALVDSIPAYANALKEANDEVTKMIVEIEQTIERKSVRQNLGNRAASNALSCANMALAGFDPVIPLDEVIETAKQVAKQMPRELRCTALGGLSITPTSLAIEERLAANRKTCSTGCGCGG